MEMPPDSHHSSLREKLLEHIFIAELMTCLWLQGRRDIEVLRAEVDNAGYDIVIGCNNVLRHIQLKAMARGAKTDSVSVQTKLAAKPSGCVIWMEFDPTTLSLGPFRFFGGDVGKTLPALGDKVARHTRGAKAERPSLRRLSRGRFQMLSTMTDVTKILFDLQLWRKRLTVDGCT